jgi:DNA-binding NtrC family response regulator
VNEREKLYLIIEDEPDMCWVMETILLANGIRSKKALDGRSAIDLMGQYQFELIFLDAKLPDIDGLDLAKKIRTLDAKIPIILISGYFYNDDMAIRAAFGKGIISNFISKPFQNEDILKAIEVAIQKR